MVTQMQKYLHIDQNKMTHAHGIHIPENLDINTYVASGSKRMCTQTNAKNSPERYIVLKVIHSK